jgi:hypothetical protein
LSVTERVVRLVKILEGFRSIRFGQGALSKNAILFSVVTAGAVGFIFATHDEKYRLVALAVIGVAFLLTHVSNFVTMKVFPQLALLEGAELVSYASASQGLKGMPAVATTVASANPAYPEPVRLPAANS